MKKHLIALLSAAALLAATTATAFAQTALPLINAEVRKVDLETQKITLKHGDIPNLEMSAMTMVFRVKDPALLQQVKAGDQVKVTVDKVKGALTVMSMEVAKP
jgi:Cu(I)/Ag(I) efflux system protein CusF